MLCTAVVSKNSPPATSPASSVAPVASVASVATLVPPPPVLGVVAAVSGAPSVVASGDDTMPGGSGCSTRSGW